MAPGGMGYFVCDATIALITTTIHIEDVQMVKLLKIIKVFRRLLTMYGTFAFNANGYLLPNRPWSN
jgi:hypothetical protein